MPFIKGKSGNIAGRKKGTANKTTAPLREWLTSFLDENRDKIKADWLLLEPAQRIALFEKLLKYTLPALSAVQIESQFDKLSDEQLDTIIFELKNPKA